MNIKDGITDMSDHPMVMVSWYGCVSYCNWKSQQEGLESCYDTNDPNRVCDFTKNGFRLATESEWEYAARGGSNSPYYRYPWGDTIDGSMSNYGASGDTYEGECIDILSRRISDFSSKKYIFSPQDSITEFRQARRNNRRTPLSCGNRSGSNRQEIPKRKSGNCYTNDSFAKACKRSCKRAGVEKFVPYDLRRTVATKTRAELGKEAARTLLGHAEQSTTDIYLLDEVQEAMKVAKALAKYEKRA